MTNGAGKRKCEYWTESFVEHTSNLESATIFRRWTAISAIAAMLERKVWVTTSSELYPNLYVFLVGDAGIGKTRPIMAAKKILLDNTEIHFGYTSMTMAKLTDVMEESKRSIVIVPEPPIQYNTVYIVADELSAFMSEYDKDLIPGLTTFYDCVPYSQGRRIGNIEIKIANPQLNVLCGSTPSNLIHFIPEFAWEQGFTSRIMLVYSNERPLIDVFNTPFRPVPDELIHDLQIINSLNGQFGWTVEYASAMQNWRESGELKGPTHPKLKHYNSRRFAHLIKLSMVACVDRCNILELTKHDFNRAMGWMLEAEQYMPDIFKGGVQSQDSQAIDEILHFVQKHGAKGVHEFQIVGYARTHVQYAHNVLRVIELMEREGLITAIAKDQNTGLRIYRADTTA